MALGKSLFDGRIKWRRLLPLFLLLDAVIVCLFLMMIGYANEAPPAELKRSTANLIIAVEVTVAPFRPTATSMPTPAAPTPTSTRVVKVDRSAIGPRQTPLAERNFDAMAHLRTLVRPQAGSAAGLAKKVSFKRDTRLVLAHYFAWYDGDGWDNCNISGGDKPLEPYHSDDPAAIVRHVQMAQSIGLNGFTLHWFAPGDRTDQNFRTLLASSQGSNFASTIVFSYHIWHGLARPTQQNIGDALRYVLDYHAPQPNFLRVDDKAVIFFTDVYRTPPGQSSQQFWAIVRDQVDPDRQTLWVAEGLDASYLEVFDGLYVFKISHAAYPHDYQKSPRWGGRVRQWEGHTGQPKLWIATISPGWDDVRSVCRPDVRIANTPHRLDRAGGSVYEATFQAALNSQPDWLIVSSFNEWVEGSYIEPSEQYGDYYMQLTSEFVRRFKEK